MPDRNHIICATRGGQGSRAAQFEAVRLARQTGARLTFLYVVDIRVLGEVDEKLTEAVHTELRWLGRAMLQVAKQRAEQLGIDTDVAIREGTVRETMADFVRENRASLLLLGAPRSAQNGGKNGDIEQFARSMEEETGVPVRIIRPEVAL